MKAPALLTSVSMRPKRSSASDTMRSAVLGSTMSPAIVRMSGSDDGLIERELATTRKLQSRYPLTRASPIPCDAPVMIATFCSAPMMGLHDFYWAATTAASRRLEARPVPEWSEYALFGRYSSAPRTNGIGTCLRLARQLLEVALESRYGIVDEGPYLRHGETPLWREQVHGQRRIFVLVEEDFQPPVPDLLGDVIGE